MRRLSILVVVLLTLLGFAPAAHAGTGTPPGLPQSMAAAGDSITRGFNASGWYSDAPTRSFSTGTDSVVASHYSRILAKNPAISGKNYNDGKSGAKASDMAGQASTAVSQGRVGYGQAVRCGRPLPRYMHRGGAPWLGGRRLTGP